MSTTVRLFSNDNRISTAVKYSSGKVYQVYPTKMTFPSEHLWQASWESSVHPQMSLRWGKYNKGRLMVNGERISTGAVTADNRVFQVYPTKHMFDSVDAWHQHWINQMKPVLTVKAAEPVKKAKAKKAKLSDWTVIERNSFKTTLDADDYYIGDLCYVFSNDMYDGIFGATSYSSGIYKENNTDRVFAVASTAYGDGEYDGSDGNKFAVDAGIIGICSKDLMAKDDGGGHMYEFNHPVICRFRGGHFSFESQYKYLSINTSGYDSDDY